VACEFARYFLLILLAPRDFVRIWNFHANRSVGQGSLANRGIAMMRISKHVPALIAAVALGVPAIASADNPLGFYVGAGVGAGHIDNNNNRYDPYGYSGGFYDHDAAWKVIAGIRPISILGAEIEYLDFGSGGGSLGYYNGYYDSAFNEHPKATILYGIGYLPLPLPFLDVYGKLGVARLQTDNSYYSTAPVCSACAPSELESRFDQQNSRIAYGVGMQAKYQDFVLRGEYERISSTFGDPDALTVSLTWTF
jgi:opacity protein-like surface antigen